VPDSSSPESVSYRAILTSIVKRFVRLVGAPAALNVARKIPRLSVDDEGNVLEHDADNPLATVTALIDAYGAVFGEVAITLSRQAVQPVADAADENLLQETGLLPAITAPTTILVVDDHVLFREGLVSLLASQSDLKVIDQAGSVREAVAKARALKPHVVLMDITLPDGTGVEATQAILAEQPNTRVVFLTVHDDDERLFAAIRAGAMGYLLKNVRASELLDRLRGVARGETGLSPAMARRVLEEFSKTPPPQPIQAALTTELTAREKEIVRELARGATNREIAGKFVISENTVKNHVRNVLSKLRLRSRRDIADYAREHGLTPPPPDSSA
jgi:DNA-binding NarL/FixJ family response regulator